MKAVILVVASMTMAASAQEKFARLALDCVGKEYPNKIAHAMSSDEDAKPPRELTPAFYGCYDWHSSVHGHWLLARLVRLHPEAGYAGEARAALRRSLTEAKLAQEARYLSAAGRQTFERPYGLAWLLMLALELREWDDAEARAWAGHLRPLEAVVVERISSWLPKLQYPVRTGEHNNTAFSLGLMLDYARGVKNASFAALLEGRAVAYYGKDKGCPLSYEPSGEDFLSPCLAEADVMRRVMGKADFGRWMKGFAPEIALEPTTVSDVTDGKLYHLAGLNLSRAWMLQGMALGLGEEDGRAGEWKKLAGRLREAGLRAIEAGHYEGGHWLGTFAVYLETGRGLGR